MHLRLRSKYRDELVAVMNEITQTQQASFFLSLNCTCRALQVEAYVLPSYLDNTITRC